MTEDDATTTNSRQLMTETAIEQQEAILDGLQGYLRNAWESSGVEVTELTEFGDGHSGHTFTVEIAGDRRGGRHVLRLSPPGVSISGPADVGRQGRIMAALAAKGLPAPAVLAESSEPVIDRRAFALMEKVEGTPWGVYAERYGHARVAESAIAALKSIQQLPVDHSGIPAESAYSPVQEIERWLPLLERSPESARNLGNTLLGSLMSSADERSAPTAPVLVHGDFHYGNLLFGSDGVRAVLDWEIASLGHPLTDLACLAVASMRHRYAPDPNPTGSVDIALSELLEKYGADPYFACWHIASSCLKYAAIIGYNLQLHRRGKKIDPIYESLQWTMQMLLLDGQSILKRGVNGIS
ncbi:phosphotransferase family protein [Rhodococcus koreensis]|uniref:phosphotransferase family protein n=1 Tax=Rhodococcus koreensis TaxID=99653 RepID=UPI00366B01E0